MSLLESSAWRDSREKPSDRLEYLETLAQRAAQVVLPTEAVIVATHYDQHADQTGRNQFPFMG